MLNVKSDTKPKSAGNEFWNYSSCRVSVIDNMYTFIVISALYHTWSIEKKLWSLEGWKVKCIVVSGYAFFILVYKELNIQWEGDRITQNMLNCVNVVSIQKNTFWYTCNTNK